GGEERGGGGVGVGWMEGGGCGSQRELWHEIPGDADARLDVRPVGVVYASVVIAGEKSPAEDGRRRVRIRVAWIGLVVIGFDLFPPGDDQAVRPKSSCNRTMSSSPR